MVPAPPDSPALTRLGSTVLGGFRLVGYLGEGSFAEAFLAQQIGMERPAVVKITHAHLLRHRHGDSVKQRFMDEVRAASRVQHPNLVTVYTSGATSDGAPAFAMEFVAGDTMYAFLARRAPLNTAQLDCFEQLASALYAIHRHSIVHRDVSPNNIVVSTTPVGGYQIKLLDFGVAKLQGSLQKTMGPLGTPGFAAPEQVGGRAVAASDMYSFGSLLWWALTGRQYLSECDSASAVLRQQLIKSTPDDPRALNAAISPRMASMVQQLLAYDPIERPTAGEVLEFWSELRHENKQHRASMGLREPLQSIPTATVRPLKVLVVESDSLRRTAIATFVERMQCTVEATDNPRDATRGLFGECDLVVLSSSIGRVDTNAIVEHLKRHFPSQRVVVASRPDAPWRPAPGRESPDLVFELPTQLLLLGEFIHAQRTTPDQLPMTPSTDVYEVVSSSILDTWRDAPEENLRGAVESFIGTMPAWIATLEAIMEDASGAEDALTICSLMETRSRDLGALHLGRLAQSMRLLILSGEFESANGYVREIETEYQRVFRRLLGVLADIESQKQKKRQGLDR